MKQELKKALQSLELSDLALVIEEHEQNILYSNKSFDERLELLLESLIEERYNKLVARLITNSNLKYPTANFSLLNYDVRKDSKTTIENLSNMKFLETNTNLVVTGPTGSGKTYLACCFGIEACKLKQRVFYIRMQDLTRRIDDLTNNTKEFRKFLTKLSNYNLLILDEWLTYKVSDKELKFIYELFEKRSDNNPTIFISQYEIKDWHERLLGGIKADSIMDRIVHNSFTIPSTTENIRKLIGNEKVKTLLESK